MYRVESDASRARKVALAVALGAACSTACTVDRRDDRVDQDTSTANAESCPITPPTPPPPSPGVDQAVLENAWEVVATGDELSATEGQALLAWFAIYSSAPTVTPDSRALLDRVAAEVAGLGIDYIDIEERYGELSEFGTCQWLQMEEEVEALFASLGGATGGDPGPATARLLIGASHLEAGPVPRRRFSARGGGFLLWLPGVYFCTQEYHAIADDERAICAAAGDRWDADCEEAHHVVNAAWCASSCGLYYAYGAEEYGNCCTTPFPEN